jgi:hypothetical protein
VNLFHTARVLYRCQRRALHRRLVASMRRKGPFIRVHEKPCFDERSSIDRFRRESGTR